MLNLKDNTKEITPLDRIVLNRKGGVIMYLEQDRLGAEFIQYVNKMAKHVKIDYLRRIKRKNEYEILNVDLIEGEIDANIVFTDMYELEDQLHFKWLLSNLNNEEQYVVYLSIFKEKTISEIAVQMHRSERWIRMVNRCALQKLRNLNIESELCKNGKRI